ncbi:MAG: 50S ribosomal protein P1 [Nanoarchaeota archaeon]|nr:50S ribosomal protein P1 [Nanoarchaeota archaeon]
MEYIYAAMLLHKAGKKVEEASVKKVLEAAGISPDQARIKALVASLEGVDIEAAIKEAAVPVAVASAPSGEAKKEDKKKDAAADEKKKEESAAAGLGALFG